MHEEQIRKLVQAGVLSQAQAEAMLSGKGVTSSAVAVARGPNSRAVAHSGPGEHLVAEAEAGQTVIREGSDRDSI